MSLPLGFLMMFVPVLAHAQEVSIHETLASGAGAAAVYGGSFTGTGWRVDDTNSRLFWDFGTQVERGTVSFVVDDVDWVNLVGDNNEFIQMFDAGDKWSCTRAVTFRVYGDLEATSWGDIKLKTWDNTSGLYSEARGGVQDWDGGPHTWSITWDTAAATLSRDGVELVRLDVAGQDLRVGTLWLPLNSWSSGYSHPIGSIYSDLWVDAWAAADDGGGDSGGGEVPEGELAPIEDVGVVLELGDEVYGEATDLPVQGASEASYLLFDLSAYAGTVTSATLTLHAGSDSHSEGDGGSVYAVGDASWSEDAVAWANRPALGAELGSFGAVAVGDAVSVDVTAGVTAGRRVALAVANGGENGVHFWSKEGAVPPSLRVVVVPDSGGDSGGDGGGDSGADSGGPGETGLDSGGGGGSDDDGGGVPGKISAGPACGCATRAGGGGPAGWGLVGLVAVAVRRRSQAALTRSAASRNTSAVMSAAGIGAQNR